MIKETAGVTVPIADNPPEARTLVSVEAIPQELTTYPSWVTWRYVLRNERWTKVPIDPKQGRWASHSDLRTWATFDLALAIYRDDETINGLGFVLSTGDPFSVVDLDHCRDRSSGRIESWAEKIMRHAGGYAETSPSGKGVHLWIRGMGPNRKRRQVECYSERRFITLTGRQLS